MRNFFIGKSKEWLEEQLDAAQKELAGGAQLTGGNAGDQGFTQEGKINLEARIANLYYSLNKLDPDTYPTADCNPATRTQAIFQDY